MVSEWLCPTCGRKFYSSNESREKPVINCANCGEKVVNPYYQEEQGE